MRFLSLQKVLFLTLILASTARAQLAQEEPPVPARNPSPNDRIEIEGQIPLHVSVQMTAQWVSNGSRECAVTVPAGSETLFFPAQAHIEMASEQVDGKTVWKTYRDYFEPGACQWRLQSILVKADRVDSENPLSRQANLSNRIVYVCTEKERCVESWAVNANNELPVYRRCRFSVLRGLSENEGRNPCATREDWEKTRESGLGKAEHLLRKNQHTVRFILTDEESTQR